MNLLLSDEYPSSIGAYVYNSDYYYVNREFEYIPEFEFKCLEQFNICKSLYESLTIWEKDEVVKYWVNQFDSYFEEGLTFLPKNIKKFDLTTFNEVASNHFLYYELKSTDPYPTFYLNYYIRKFRFLIINFFLFEEQCNLESLRITDYARQEFNPKEFLNLPEIFLPVELQNEINQSKITQKTIVCFFHLLRDSELKPKGSFANNEYCRMLCEEFNFQYADKLAKHFSIPDLSIELPKVKKCIFPNLNEDIRSKLETHLQNNCT
ncbi:hypothetical protein [Aquirufa aurantiipilula]|uniref:hypothetical protein n=1 Tax=Aquirufa aurantiipilula TaxID=2696561 RepID=UPI001CAA5AC3|nr:hypothetical protein [Aquirufa aurantiipilula]MBZ1327731.1 hypothetical protein [Aquirufa aurantiipilula]